MRIRRYYGYLYAISYLVILRAVLWITTDISMINFGIVFDVVLMMFWVGIFAFFMKSLRVQKIYYIIVVLIATMFVVGDSLYFEYFETISARSSLSGLQWLASEGTTVEYNVQIPLVGYLITPLLIGVIYLIISNKRKDVFYIRDFAILSLVFFVQIILFLVWGSYSFDTRYEYYQSDAYLFESMYDRSLYSERYGYYSYHLLDLTRIRPKPDKETLYEEVDAYFENQTAHVQNDYSDMFAGYNVITIIGETLETRFIDATLTPNLYELKTNGWTFDNFYTTVFQQGATCNSEYMSLTGMSAITTNDWSNNICDAYTENLQPYALPNQLKDIGYDTYYFHSGHEWFYDRKTIVPNYGFDTVKFQEDIIQDGYTDFSEHYDTQLMDFVDEYVTFIEPFMMTFLTYSMHGAYNQFDMYDMHDDQVQAAYDTDELPSQIYNYMQKLVEFDTFIGDLLTRLETEGVLDNTLIAIYPDHYPYMMDYTIYSDYVNEYESHDFMNQDFILYTTSMEGNRYNKVGSTIDITPTIMNLINSSGKFKYFTGTDLFSDTSNYVLFSDLTITDGTNKLFLNKELIGDSTQLTILEQALEAEITALENQKHALNIDYFRMKHENSE